MKTQISRLTIKIPSQYLSEETLWVLNGIYNGSRVELSERSVMAQCKSPTLVVATT